MEIADKPRTAKYALYTLWIINIINGVITLATGERAIVMSYVIALLQ